MKNKALYESSHLLLQYRISSPTLDDIITIVAQYGYEIIDYDPSSRSTQELMASLLLNHQILSQNAFLYTNHNVKLLFVRDNLDAEDKRVAITHELGHIVCKHADTSIQEEYEANEFVHYFLNPPAYIRICNGLYKHKIIIAVILLVVTCTFFCINAMINNRYSTYYVTQNGTKYHTRNCVIIHDKNGLRRLTKDEAQSEIYEPCSVCLKNHQDN